MTIYNQAYSSPRPLAVPTLETAIAFLYGKFKTQVRFYALFHLIFVSFLIIQIFSFILFFSYFSQSTITALALAFFVFTFFSYFVLTFFFETKKTEQWMLLRKEFAHLCQTIYEQDLDQHFRKAEAAQTAALFLQQEEPSFYISTTPIKALVPVIEKVKVRLFWKNFFQLKELLLLLSVEELIGKIKLIPTSLDTHATLAQTYMELGLLYVHPSKKSSPIFPWIPSEYVSERMQEKFRLCMERSIEECKILQAYGVQDRWIYVKLAEIYQLQDKAEEELFQYEELLALEPSNEEVLMRLGILCFKQGYNAKGLNLYEQLRQFSPKKAEYMISHYDSHSLEELLSMPLLVR